MSMAAWVYLLGAALTAALALTGAPRDRVTGTEVLAIGVLVLMWPLVLVGAVVGSYLLRSRQ